MRPRAWLPLALAAAGCLAAVLLAGALGPVTFSAGSPLDRFRLQTQPLDQRDPVEEAVVDIAPPPAQDASIPAEVVLSLAAVVVASALLARSLLRARGDAGAEDDPDDGSPVDGLPAVRPGALGAVAAAARDGLADLDGGGDATAAVLACWVGLEDAAARLGRGRTPTDTPTDVARRLLAAAPGLDPVLLDDLRRTYSRARHGGPAGPDDVRRARAALEDLLAVLSAAGPDRQVPGRAPSGRGQGAGS
ncbi:DUF4129 domain-containing protein [Aquipuribacter hungaricus]|uniref:DUF4129 domain-containing protein n=1 Tax=Aquipuribacter hungaricus TaxID=545624 RepID=A0ABV7WAM0_9MICO